MSETLLHQFLTAILSAQVFSSIISVGGLGAIAFYGHKLVRQSAIENLRIAERKLFLDLIQRRTDWWLALSKAHDTYRDNIASGKTLPEGSLLNAGRLLDALSQDASRLFDADMVTVVDETLSCLYQMWELRVEMSAGDVDHHSGLVTMDSLISRSYELMSDVSSSLYSYVYVGDIKKPVLLSKGPHVEVDINSRGSQS